MSELTVSQGFSDTTKQIAVVETQSTAIAAQAKAMIESRYIMAMRNPRNWDQVRTDLLKECKRPGFAHNKSTYYRKPIGQGVEGLGIRFVEVALRCMKNVLIETSMIFEDEQKEIHRVSVTDLESNITYPLDVKVTKTVERSKPNDDGSFISQRKNSSGKTTFTVQAQDDDLLNKRGAMISKAVRTLGLRIIPGDLQDEAEAIIKRIRLDAAAQDPDAERKRIVDAFSGIGVKAVDLTAYLGHAIDQCSPAQLVDLRGIYGAIKDGEATWKLVMDNKEDSGEQAELMPKPKSKQETEVAKPKPRNEPKTEQAPSKPKPEKKPEPKPEPEPEAEPEAQPDVDNWGDAVDGEFIDEETGEIIEQDETGLDGMAGYIQKQIKAKQDAADAASEANPDIQRKNIRRMVLEEYGIKSLKEGVNNTNVYKITGFLKSIDVQAL